MKKFEDARQENGKVKKMAARLLAGSLPPDAEPFGGDWPWCAGIIYQPRHPKMMQNDESKATKE